MSTSVDHKLIGPKSPLNKLGGTFDQISMFSDGLGMNKSQMLNVEQID